MPRWISGEVTTPDARVAGEPCETLMAGLHGGAEDFQDLALGSSIVRAESWRFLAISRSLMPVSSQRKGFLQVAESRMSPHRAARSRSAWCSESLTMLPCRPTSSTARARAGESSYLLMYAAAPAATQRATGSGLSSAVWTTTRWPSHRLLRQAGHASDGAVWGAVVMNPLLLDASLARRQNA